MDLSELTPVDSSLAAAVGYDEQEQEMYIEFKQSGQIWAYPITPAEWQEAQSGSIGKFWHARIKGVKSGRQVA
jgi:hypothetical protein